jgi:hypothetical protein
VRQRLKKLFNTGTKKRVFNREISAFAGLRRDKSAVAKLWRDKLRNTRKGRKLFNHKDHRDHKEKFFLLRGLHNGRERTSTPNAFGAKRAQRRRETREKAFARRIRVCGLSKGKSLNPSFLF